MRFYLLLIALIFARLSQAQVTPAEKAALQAFYNATDGHNWLSENDADLTNDWDFTGPVTNDWKGITVSAGNVTEIDMNPINTTAGNNNLTGMIPEEIGDLVHLQRLNLALQNLTGTLPTRFTDLIDLRSIRLRGNEFTGPIPDSIDKLTQLIYLDLASNQFTDEIPISLTTLPNIQFLYLDGNELGGEIPIEVTDILTLRELNLGHNNFTGFIYPEYGKLTNLTDFNLNNNQLTGVIPPSLQTLTELVSLHLTFNEISGTLPVELRLLTKLERLELSYNNLTGNIPIEYGELISLGTLHISDNQLTGTIPLSFNNLTNLEYLSLANNQLSGELSPTFSSWVNINRLNLNNNEFTGEIPESYISFTNLTFFNASNNNLSGELSPLFSNWSNINSLYLRQNDFSGEIPETYSSLTTLERLDVSHNQFSGELSPSFSNWNNIEFLVFQDNEFEGTIPNFTLVLTPDDSNDWLQIDQNKFQFGDFESEFNFYNEKLFSFLYDDQAKVNDIEAFDDCIGSSITLTTDVSGTANIYQWLKDGSAITGANSADLILEPLSLVDEGVYTCEITSTIVTGLTLERNPITVTINDDAPIANDIQDINTCDEDNDGFATFTIDLAALESQTIGNQTGLIVSYYDATGNPLVLTDNFMNTTSNVQPITVRITNSNGCFDETSFNLTVSSSSTAERLQDVTACGSFTLPQLEPGNNYYTQSGAAGMQLQAEEIITMTQNIYIYAGEGDCSDQSNFLVTIEPLPIINELDDITACGLYVLPQLNGGNYYTQSGGTGTLLGSGEEITASQAIYIYDDNGICSKETSFQVNIDIIACDNSEEAIKLKFPKFFTPNEDGVNDVWKVEQNFFSLKGLVTIYDRYGKLLYQFNTENGSWNGTLNGKRLPETDYWYKFIETESNAVITGHFSLKR
ncbi:T9SS type B sorting domain-containing protein [Zobellia roscoffensis]|uniref:T9SS type B sorting domain-containing protein n=1 Tax=Zobellia roscoffensis TaxID=2779508 RepID=UPI00188B4C48|nr:T9SS type B sorting domain-containing protein [Zobellia roscoffensis]